MDWLKEWGGLLAMIISGLWTVACVFVAYYLRVDAKEKAQTVELITRLGSNIDLMRTGMDNFKENAARDHRQISIELKQVAERAEGSREDLKRLEGRIDSQQNTIFTFTERIVEVSGQLKAVFRIIDAKPRASD